MPEGGISLSGIRWHLLQEALTVGNVSKTDDMGLICFERLGQCHLGVWRFQVSVETKTFVQAPPQAGQQRPLPCANPHCSLPSISCSHCGILTKPNLELGPQYLRAGQHQQRLQRQILSSVTPAHHVTSVRLCPLFHSFPNDPVIHLEFRSPTALWGSGALRLCYPLGDGVSNEISSS